MLLTDRLLMGPGPCNPYPEVAVALARPMLGHLDPEFLVVLDETCQRLRDVFRTANALTLPLSGTGSAAMEAAFVNVVAPGDVVVVGVNGLFGERMSEVASRCGGHVVRVEERWGEAIDPDRLLGAHPDPTVIAVVHAETSTGVRNDIETLGAGKGDALLLVDCVTSLGGMAVEVDRWQIDVAYSASQQCLGVPPGLAPITVSDRARERLVERPRSWYFDLELISGYVGGADGARTYHHTAPVSMVYALHAGLGALLDEGLDDAWHRHAECGRLVRDGLVKLGFELCAAEGHRLPQLTAAWVPDHVDEAAARATLLERHGVEVGAGLGPFAGRAWRVGCMGHTARARNVATLLATLEEVLDR